eukprot:141780-Amphidinium_carterae.1
MFKIRLRSDAVTDTSAVSLANALEGLVRLRHLALDLKSDYIGDLGLGIATHTLPSRESTQSIKNEALNSKMMKHSTDERGGSRKVFSNMLRG